MRLQSVICFLPSVVCSSFNSLSAFRADHSLCKSVECLLNESVAQRRRIQFLQSTVEERDLHIIDMVAKQKDALARNAEESCAAETRFTQLSSCSADQNRKISALESEVSANKSINNELLLRVVTLESSAQELKQELETTHAQRSRLESQHQETLAVKQRVIHQLEATNTRTNGSLLAERTRITQLTTEKDRLQAELTVSGQMLAQLLSQRTTAEATVAQRETRIRELERQIARLTERASTAEAHWERHIARTFPRT